MSGASAAGAGHRRAGTGNPGWSERIFRRTGASVGAGAVAGTGYALLRNEPALVTAGSTAASFGIVALTFCSLQELCRLLRQADGPENSLLAGAASGALLRGLHHGRAFALPGAIATGAVAYATHHALDAHAAGAFNGPLDALRNADMWAWSPIKRISDEEIAAREATFAERVARATGPGAISDGDGPFVKLGKQRAALPGANTGGVNKQ